MSQLDCFHSFDIGATPQKSVEQQAAIFRIRAWAGTIKDDCVREAYEYWLKDFEESLAESRKEPEAEARTDAAGMPPETRP